MRGLQEATAKLATFLEELNKVESDGTIQDLILLLKKNDYIMLLPGVTPAYALRTRAWIKVELENIQPITEVAQWDDLILPKSHKKMVRAMVEAYTTKGHVYDTDSRFEADLVHGKAQRYCLWYVFLRPGGSSSNVTVFLRILEYHPGLLFITTNQVGVIDDAFRSRLHLMLYYPPLSSKQSYKIWETNLQRLQAQSEARIKNGMPRLIIRKKSILSFAKTNFKQLNWNGRQIRNAFQSALALAVFNASHTKSKRSNPVVSKREFRTVGDFVKQFESYLKETHQGVGEASIALEDEVRADMVDGRQGGLEISDTEYSDSESEDEYLTKSGNSEEQDEPSHDA
ncbi:AAA family ATPase [Ilyonectria robusta]